MAGWGLGCLDITPAGGRGKHQDIKIFIVYKCVTVSVFWQHRSASSQESCQDQGAEGKEGEAEHFAAKC